MDMFQYSRETLLPTEGKLAQQKGVRLYDGDERYKMRDDLGVLQLTSHRLIWSSPGLTTALELKHIVLTEREAGSSKGLFQKSSPKIIVHVQKADMSSIHSPFLPTKNLYFKLSFTDGGMEEFYNGLSKTLNDKQWTMALLPGTSGKYRAGILGIERQMAQESRETHQNISQAFQDINSLIEMAKPMVSLSQAISKKIRDKQGSLTDDETVLFRTHLLSLGIKDPVTKAKFGSGVKYFESLAGEVCKLLEGSVNEAGGLMSLVEAYCRVNRARGMELLSPEDLVSACATMERLNLPLKLILIGQDVQVLQHVNFSDELCIVTAISLLEKHTSFTAEEYARACEIPVLLAKHSLLLTETHGKTCRDESVEGLRFYKNLFNEF